MHRAGFLLDIIEEASSENSKSVIADDYGSSLSNRKDTSSYDLSSFDIDD
jgi:hypothetical protein